MNFYGNSSTPGPLTIGTVNNTVGLTATGDITLAWGGDVTQTEKIRVANGLDIEGVRDTEYFL